MPDLSLLLTGENAAAFATLTVLEVVLGIDNIVFIAILANKLEEHKRKTARRVGLLLAMGVRILMLLAIGWVMGLTEPLFVVPGIEHEVSGRDLILLIGGLFLLGKATHEIHDKVEGSKETIHQPKAASFGSVITQIVLLDIIFSLDSVITAVGMVKSEEDAAWIGLTIMISAVVIAVGSMLFFAGPIANFVEKHPTTKMLALAFLMMIGVVLVAEGCHAHFSKGYIYSALAFSLFVEMLNLWAKKNRGGKKGDGKKSEPSAPEPAG